MKTILITGASGGIGLELATACAEHGHNVVLVARGHERLKAIATDIEATFNVKAMAIEQDLSLPGAAQVVVSKIAKAKIQIDGLINNAGFGLGGRFTGEDEVQIHNMIAVNITALTELTRLLAPGMVERGSGRILNVASVAAFLPGPFMAVYYATKAYVLSLSIALAEELRGTGVTVTALCPGPTKTNFATTAQMQGSKLFSGNHLDAHAVAQAGYKAMMAGRITVTPGASNQLSIFATRFIPRSLLARGVRRIQEPHNG